jgi:hypothetical protein
MSKITDYYTPSYTIITAIAMKLNIISTKKIITLNKLQQKLITDYYKPSHLKNIYNIPGQYKITKYFPTIN